MTEPGHWAVRARVERFAEPAVLLLLTDGPKHGYELLERLPELAGGEEVVDLGNLYRMLRALEQEGVVTSEWRAEVSGPAKRTYELTDTGRALLERWAESLRRVGTAIEAFLRRYEQHGQGEGR
jgi:poly-beta-hydroxybutyrate-responsive repressor